MSEPSTLARNKPPDPVAARRRARFTYLLRRARKDVEGEPRLTEDERDEIARIWRAGPDGGAS